MIYLLRHQSKCLMQPPIGELSSPSPMDLSDFEAAQKRLSGMNEASSKVNLKTEFTVS